MHAGEAATQDAAVEEVAEFFADEPWEAAVLVFGADEERLEVLGEDAIERGLLGDATVSGRLRRRHTVSCRAGASGERAKPKKRVTAETPSSSA